MRGGILVVAAHPDDETLGCGGAIAGRGAAIIWMGSGRDVRQVDDGEKAVQSLGGYFPYTLCGDDDEWSDNRLDMVPMADICSCVERAIDEVKPDIIYTHHPGDLNIDHRITAQAVLTATRPIAGRHIVKEVYAFEVPSSTEWGFQRIEPVFRPNTFVNIEETLETKIRALQCYESEVRPFPHPRSPEAIRAYAARWGSVCGCKAAEAFELIRAIR